MSYRVIEDRKLLEDIIGKFGNEEQISIFIEECGEALTAISHFRRGRISIELVIEELVDLFITLNQMRIIYDPTGKEFDKIYKYKIQRIRTILNAE